MDTLGPTHCYTEIVLIKVKLYYHGPVRTTVYTFNINSSTSYTSAGFKITKYTRTALMATQNEF